MRRGLLGLLVGLLIGLLAWPSTIHAIFTIHNPYLGTDVTFAIDQEVQSNAMNGTGWISGGDAVAQVPPDMTVNLSSGLIGIPPAPTEVLFTGNAFLAIAAADAAYNRVDLISVDQSGTVVVTTGTAENWFYPPALPGSGTATPNVLLYFIMVPAGTTGITDEMIIDKRIGLRSGALFTSTGATVSAFEVPIYQSSTIVQPSTLTYDGSTLNTGPAGLHVGSDKFIIDNAGKISLYDNATIVNGQLLIGNTTTARFEKATLTAGANVTITNNPGAITIAAAGVTVPGSSTQLIFNDSGAFGADTGLTWDKTVDRLALGVASSSTGSLRYHNSSNANTVTVQAGATTSSYTMVLPTAPPASVTSMMTMTTGGVLGTQAIPAAAGSNTQVQFNDAGAFGADSGLTYDSANDRLIIGTPTVTTGSIRYNNATNGNTITVQAGTTTTSYTIKWPVAAPGTTQMVTMASTGDLATQTIPSGSGGATITSYTPQFSAGATLAHSSLTVRNTTEFILTGSMTLNQIAMYFTAAATPGTLKTCIYDNSGARVVDATLTPAVAVVAASVSAVSLPAGQYTFIAGCATTCNVTALSYNNETAGLLLGTNVNSKRPWHGTVTHASGGCDSTLGTVTGANQSSPAFRLDN